VPRKVEAWQRAAPLARLTFDSVATPTLPVSAAVVKLAVAEKHMQISFPERQFMHRITAIAISAALILTLSIRCDALADGDSPNRGNSVHGGGGWHGGGSDHGGGWGHHGGNDPNESGGGTIVFGMRA
jgi:uncharacterized membrane protein YgcG